MARPSAVPQITAPVRHAPVARFAPPPGSGEAPFFARIACARAPAFAPARLCAPDCAREPSGRAHVSCLFHWVFFAPAPGEAASGHRLLLIHATTEFPESSLSWKQNGIFSGFASPAPGKTPRPPAGLRRRPRRRRRGAAARLLYNRSFLPGGIGLRNGPYRLDAAQPERRRERQQEYRQSRAFPPSDRSPRRANYPLQINCAGRPACSGRHNRANLKLGPLSAAALTIPAIVPSPAKVKSKYD